MTPLTDDEEARVPSPPMILIVDDDPITSRLVRDALAGEGYHCLTADGGAAALAEADAHDLDLVLLDVMMPGMDGVEVCRRLRAHPRQAEVPILVVTALDDRAIRQEAVDAGADDFLSKPIDRAEVRTRVRSIVRLGRYGRLREEVAAARQAAGQLLESHERLERVSRALVRAQEDERRRVAADLHDDLGQLLTALKLGLERARSSTDPHALATALAEGARLAGRAIEEVGRLARRLRPAVLDDLGLAVALESLACEAASSAGLALELEIDHEVSRRDPEVELACYRITQEAVNNTMRHADARWLRVAFSGDAESIRLEVQDDGLGFDPQSPRPGPGLGLGLEGMAERAELLGGRLEVSSLPGRGTRVVARFPAPEPEPESGSAGRRHLPEGAAS